MKYTTVIGLEIHIELNTNSKMFCSCKNDSEEKNPNVNICPVCTAQPGSLPVINKEAVKKVIKTGYALRCSVASISKFDRKNYFYPDLPKGYQISQYDIPLCKGGFLEVDGRKIDITRIHLEEDTGRLIHSGGDSLVDFNRAGVPLMELVTEPDLTSAQETRRFAEELRLIARYLDVSSADMEKGQMRVEANISLKSGEKLGTKVEIKNLNSFKAVEKAIEYEVERQKEILDSGKEIIQETRGWDDNKQITVSQRSKEEAHDYRYFPEPDLPALEFSEEFLNEIKADIPELPQNKRKRFKEEYGLGKEEIEIFVFNKNLSEYFEQVVSELKNWLKTIKKDVLENDKIAKLASNYILTDLQGLLKGKSVEEEDFLITPENFAEFIVLIFEGKISSKIAKKVLKEMFSTGADPSHIIEDKGLSQIEDTGEIENVVKDVISKNEKAAEDYKKGKENALQFLAGQIMAATKGRANPETVIEILKKSLK